MLFAVIGVLLTQCFWSHAGTDPCEEWVPLQQSDDVCCKRCTEGYRIVKTCGPLPYDLCIPCENGTFTLDPSQKECTKCRQCGGVQHRVAECTRTQDTRCGCKDPLLCEDKHCSRCVHQCGRGREPHGGSCRDCPAETFNNQNNQKCKPWRSIPCTHPNEYKIRGDAYTDSRCVANATITTTMATTTQRHIESKKAEEDTMLPWWLVIAVSCVVLLVPLILMTKVITKLKPKKGQTPARKPPLITTPTDEPRTLMAIECSFHEPEQVSSSESLATEDSEGSTQKLIV